jgi:hypothetical protein
MRAGLGLGRRAMGKKKPQLPAVVKGAKPVVEKDQHGHFAPGNSGGPGRPPGIKNRFSEGFISDFHEAWRTHGVKALRHMAEHDPTNFIRAAVQLMPKDVLVDARGAGIVVVKLSDEDMAL